MLYIGHFSFAKDNKNIDDFVDDNMLHGYFTTVVEAENVDNALEKFRNLIYKLGNEGDIFDGVNEVFLDACIEAKTIPDSGFLAHFVEWTGLPDGSISTAIRGATEEEVSAYSYEPEDIDDDSNGFDVEPFLLLEKKKQ